MKYCALCNERALADVAGARVLGRKEPGRFVQILPIAQEPAAQFWMDCDVAANYRIIFSPGDFKCIFSATAFGEHLRLFYRDNFADSEPSVQTNGKNRLNREYWQGS